jgi:hypothetical protein
LRYIFYVIALILLIAGVLTYPVSRDWLIKQTIEFAASSSNAKLKIGSLKATGHDIIIKDANFLVKNTDTVKIENITINYSLDDILKDKKATMHIDIGGKTTILGEDATLEARIDYSAVSLKKYNLSVKINKLSSSIFGELGLNPLQGTCNIITTKTSRYASDCSISDGSTNLSLDMKSIFSDDKFESFEMKGNMKELPVDLHKLFHHIMPKDLTMQYIYDNISGARVKNGSWEINLPSEFFADFKMKPEYLNGKFNIENIALNYDPEFPTLQKINTELTLKGSILDFQISSAYSHNTKLENASIFLDWGAEEDGNLLIKADAKGPVSDLTDFMPKASLKSLQNSKIDLTKFAGTAISKVNITVSLSDVQNKYDITTTINDAKLQIFNGNVILTNTKLSGLFDGKHLQIKGKCAINGMNSEIDFINNLEGKEEFDNILGIKINLAKRDTGDLLPIYSFGEGKAVLDITYKDKNDISQILATSNLTNISFNIAKLGIHKAMGVKAALEIKGTSTSSDIFPIDINLHGTNMNIVGQSVISPKITKLSFSKIISNDTNIKADIEIEPQAIRTKISGKLLDLSNVNMMQFLTKDKSDTAADIKVGIDVIRLKNDIYLDHFKLGMKCSRKKCSEGIMNANLGSKSIDFVLHPQEDHEEWNINITNAGAALKGFDMVNNIKSGELSMIIKTNINKAEAGKAIPIAEGNFSLKKFVTVDNKILTRLVSFVSLPGLMSAITNNKNISFTEMKGKFSYKDNVVNIYDGNATGAFLDLTIKGSIFTDEHKVKIKGTIIPSLYGINTIVNKIPVIGTIFGGKHRKGIFSAPYSIEYKY